MVQKSDKPMCGRCSHREAERDLNSPVIGGSQDFARPEDKALLRSNLSAEAGDRADGQGRFGDPAIPSFAVVVIQEVTGLPEIEP